MRPLFLRTYCFKNGCGEELKNHWVLHRRIPVSLWRLVVMLSHTLKCFLVREFRRPDELTKCFAWKTYEKATLAISWSYTKLKTKDSPSCAGWVSSGKPMQSKIGFRLSPGREVFIQLYLPAYTTILLFVVPEWILECLLSVKRTLSIIVCISILYKTLVYESQVHT